MSKAQTRPGETATLNLKDYDAFIFDLDGVVTQTAAVHADAWKEMFDAFLAQRSERDNEQHKPFDIQHDYRSYVDGKPRYDGVHSFLESRKISLPWGNQDDPPEAETVCGLGARKNEIYEKRLERDGAKVFESTVALIKRLKASGIRVGIFSSSKNCAKVLKTVGLENLFEARVDGTDLTRLNLRGKPEPDMLIETARQLGSRPERAVVFEDAISGVQAGRAGGFATVVGVDREQHGEELAQNGADIVVRDLVEIALSNA